jgi:N-acetylated-alpha-linked acidic dipeptidase
MRRYLPALDESIRAKNWSASTAPLATAIDGMASAASAFAVARDAALAGGTPSSATLRSTNAALLRVERALTRPAGLRTRPWFRSLIYAADEDNGYANIALPSVAEAIRAGDVSLTTREIADLASRFDAAAAALKDATEAIGKKS